MLDLGFLPPIRRIVAQLTSKRQNLFFSATMPREIGRLADDLLRDPVRIAVTPSASTVDSVTQRVLHVESEHKRALLVELFADPQMSRALVFTRTKRGADKVARHLEAAGIRVAAIHGNKSQSQREQALAAFRAAKIRALVATDIAARGIDVDQVTHVVNFELPDVPESYVHRIGRTARAGAAGIAISLCDAEEGELLRDIERLTRKSIAAEDRRHDTSRSISPQPRRPSGRGNARGPAARGAADDRGSRQERQQRDFHGRQQQSQKNRGFRSAAGPARYNGAGKQSAGRTGSF
jgi:ATP-dependent RNA helicase RhlE